MITIERTVADPIGVHAQVASLLAAKVKQLGSAVRIVKGKTSADASNILAVIGLGIKSGETVSFTVSGQDEAVCAQELVSFLRENF